MQAFKKWAEGRPVVVAVLAHMYASMAPLAYGLLETVKDDRNFVKEGEQPNLNLWLGLYKKQRKVRTAMMGIFHDPSGFFNFERDVFSGQENIDSDSTPDDLAQWFSSIFTQEIAKNLLQSYIASQQTTAQQLEKSNPGGIATEIISKPEFYFWIRVYLPCWLLYGELPGRLLRKSRQGNIDALDKLIRLDSSTIFDPKISILVHSYRAYDKKKHDIIISAFSNPPKTRTTIRRLKAFIAALIKVTSFAFDHELTEPQIRGLFDAIAKDQGTGEIDPHIPDSPHAFYMAIQREVPFWVAAFSSHRK